MATGMIAAAAFLANTCSHVLVIKCTPLTEVLCSPARSFVTIATNGNR